MTVEIDAPFQMIDEAQVDYLLSGLQGFSPAMGASEIGGTDIVLTVSQETYTSAMQLAVRMVEELLRRDGPMPGQVVSVLVMSTQEFDRRYGLGAGTT
ncbi:MULTISPECIES: hypothetical protein [unclassified Rhodococcus (in: high G+C Gram-positive bacteria)]|uniref:hypothetical protein n=1 Tax=unclassified Rhodococcus (in: high G+C Gram-positive bacteria) TaxID=192944 RepID=UPI0002DEF20A|nr:hypothetical protein [Rhodococcus sp. DK17]